MGSNAFFRATLVAIMCSFLFAVTTFAQQAPNLRAAGQTFVGTWESTRTNLCGPCLLKIKSIEEAGKVIGTLMTNPDGTTALNAAIINEKGKTILRVLTPRGNQVDFNLPAKEQRKMYGTFASGYDDMAFTRQ